MNKIGIAASIYLLAMTVFTIPASAGTMHSIQGIIGNPHIPVISPATSNIVYGVPISLTANDMMYDNASQWFNTTGVGLYQSERIGSYALTQGTNTAVLNLTGLRPGTYNYTFCIASGNSYDASGWKYNKNFCSTTYVQISEPKFIFVAFTVSAPVVDVGQYETLTSYVSGGVSPYTYNFYVYNATNVLVTSASYGNVYPTSNSFTFQFLPQWGTGIFEVYSTVTDSNGQFASDPTAITVK